MSKNFILSITSRLGFVSMSIQLILPGNGIATFCRFRLNFKVLPDESYFLSNLDVFHIPDAMLGCCHN